MSEVRAFLGVGESLTGRRWTGLDADAERMSLRMVQETGLPEPVARLLSAAGVPSEYAREYLKPTVRDLLSDPSRLLDAEAAAKRLVAAVEAGDRVAIFADYDVDGATSGAQLVEWFRHFHLEPDCHVPDREKDGFGPTPTIMQSIAADHDLIICVDCGSQAHEAIAAAGSADVVIIDHHICDENLPPALAVVNPNRQDESGELGHLCAAGVVFMVLVAANRLIRASSATGPDLLEMLDLVALATVADVVPLTGINRAFVRSGLRVLSRRRRTGLVALADEARLNAPPTSHHLGFVLGPRINAAGRMGRSGLGLELLRARSQTEATNIAKELEALNDRRKELSDEITSLAIAFAKQQGLDRPLVWASNDGWPAGIVGLAAGRLAATTNRPSIVIGFDGDVGKGSGRSVPGIDLGHAVLTCLREGLLVRGGGHRMAVGLTVRKEMLVPAMTRLGELLERQGAGQAGPADLMITGAMEPGAAHVDLVEQLEAAGPFGASAPPPRFAFPSVAVKFLKHVGASKNHLMMTLEGESTRSRIKASAFRVSDGPIEKAFIENSKERLHVAGRLEINDWNGRHVRLIVEDVALPSAS